VSLFDQPVRAHLGENPVLLLGWFESERGASALVAHVDGSLERVGSPEDRLTVDFRMVAKGETTEWLDLEELDALVIDAADQTDTRQ
jgi:hypothetical protein